MADDAPKGLSRRAQLGVLAFVLVMGALAAYARFGGTPGPLTPAQCQATLAAAGGLAPLAKGEVAIFRPVKASQDLSGLPLADANGKLLRLSSFEGRTVLLNFWATWCVPCRAEMPALDRLQASQGGKNFEVVAVNMDLDSTAEKEKAFLSEIGVQHLVFYADPNLLLTSELKRRGLVFGLPTTILVDGNGCQQGTAEGGAAWDSAEAKALIAGAMSAS